MCDLCSVLLPGVTNMTTRKGPFKHQEGWTSTLDPVTTASKMHRQVRCIRKVNAATQALWKSIWKIFKQIQKQVPTQPFHQNFPVCSPQPLSSERRLQWLTGLLPSPSAAATREGLKPGRHLCCLGKYPEGEKILKSHITLAGVSSAKLCLAKNAPNMWKPPYPQDGSPGALCKWPACGIWLTELVL